jgi:methionyl-tRNA formyltransferase
MNTLIASNRPFPSSEARTPKELDSLLKEQNFIYFPFWSWKVPKEITNKYYCIGFHTGNTNGGSPIQNLIRQGEDKANIRMFHMNDTIDGGVDLQIVEISLLGSLEEIIIRMTDRMKDMIDGHIQANN